MPAPLELLADIPMTRAPSNGFSVFRTDPKMREAAKNRIAGSGERVPARKIVAGLAEAWQALSDAEKAVWGAKANESGVAGVEPPEAIKKTGGKVETVERDGDACQSIRPTPPTTVVLPPVKDLEHALLGSGAGDTPIAFRMRVTYYLRTIGERRSGERERERERERDGGGGGGGGVDSVHFELRICLCNINTFSIIFLFFTL